MSEGWARLLEVRASGMLAASWSAVVAWRWIGGRALLSSGEGLLIADLDFLLTSSTK